MPLRAPCALIRCAMVGVALAQGPAFAQAQAPIRYTVRFPDPAAHLAEVEARIPTDASPQVELMMPVWSPGYYVEEDYADRILDLGARTPEGRPLTVVKTRKNRWRVATAGANTLVVSYRLRCEQRSVTTNWVDAEYAVLNGPATYLTRLDGLHRPHDLQVELPAHWKAAVVALPPAPDGRRNHFRAVSYDQLVDAPLLAGNPRVHAFHVKGTPHALVEVGEPSPRWDGALAARNLQKIAEANHRLWGFLPFPNYLFLSVFRPGGGGLEHLDSTLLTSSPALERGGDARWLAFVSHEYFHAFNVKRLRPVELGPFDYEQPPRSASLWISEGLTTYYGHLMVSRAGLATPEGFLDALSALIDQLQSGPGRKVQTLEQASLQIFATGGSGVGGDRDRTVSYYVKGAVLGFLLDARIQHATDGQRSLDDLMKGAYARYGGATGFTPAQFQAAASEVASMDLSAFFRQTLTTTDELDYAEALAWFGLRFAPTEDPVHRWKLERHPAATEAQKARFNQLAGAR